jgi:hypothetical protein
MPVICKQGSLLFPDEGVKKKRKTTSNGVAARRHRAHVPVDTTDLPPPRPPAERRVVNRLLSEPCATRLYKIMRGSPKLSPVQVVQSALNRGEWMERVIEDHEATATVEIVPNPDYKPTAHSTVLCHGCVWRDWCGLTPAHVDCDYEMED